jgi:hypothetical protein
MDFHDMLSMIQQKIDAQPKLRDCEAEHSEIAGYWRREKATAEVTQAGSTGILLKLGTNGRPVHERTFARSVMSVDRIVVSITEHLTGYAY